MTTEKTLAAEAKHALNIARKNKKQLVLLFGSGPIFFSKISKVKESSTADNIVHVSGFMRGAYSNTYNTCVSIDLNRVDAIVDPDLSSLEEDILEGL
jgi:hypothetical protein